MPLLISTLMMFQAQNREIINSTWKVVVSFKIIDNECDKTVFNNTTQHQTCKTKTYFVSLRPLLS